jgi:hypothetical protein
MDPKAAMEAIKEMFGMAAKDTLTEEEREELIWHLDGLARWIENGGSL